MSHKAIVLDANILIRAVLGKRVRGLIIDNAAQVKFLHQMWRMQMHESISPLCWRSEA